MTIELSPQQFDELVQFVEAEIQKGVKTEWTRSYLGVRLLNPNPRTWLEHYQEDAVAALVAFAGTPLTESVSSAVTLREAIDSVPVTLIAPGWSSNGRYYSKEVLKASISRFEGAQAYADHPTKSERQSRPER